jgi:hypothetical protein
VLVVRDQQVLLTLAIQQAAAILQVILLVLELPAVQAQAAVALIFKVLPQVTLLLLHQAKETTVEHLLTRVAAAEA